MILPWTNPTQPNPTQPKPLGVVFCVPELWVMSCHRSGQVLVTKCAVRQLFRQATPTKPKQNKKGEKKKTLHKSIVPSNE